MTLTLPPDTSAFLATPPAPETAEPSQATPPRGGLAGLVAEIGIQHRANAHARRQRRRDARDHRAARRAPRHGTDGENTGTGLGAWLRALPGSVQEGGVQVGYGMALMGSGVGQLSWWSSQFPLLIAASFALSFEAIMLGSSRRARRLRRQGHAAAGLRLIAWSAAMFGAGLNWVHLSDPQTTLVLGHQLVHGSPSLGAAFAAFTALGFATHEVSTSADVRSELVRKGYLRPLGARRWLPPFTARAWRARLLLIEDPALMVDQAWSQAGRPHGRRKGWIRRHRSEDHEPVAEPAPAEVEQAHNQPPAPAEEPAAEADTASTDPAGVPAAEETVVPTQSSAPIPASSARSTRTDTTEEILADEVWMAMLRPVAQAMFAAGDWFSVNDVRRASCAVIREGTKGVGKQRASRLLEQLTIECPSPPPSPARDDAHRERIMEFARNSIPNRDEDLISV